jgi:NADH:ubiquinone oxidoreductase subunit 5 (subunit L)/multisubunit Na+/H+ antiporter MnhA subunit
VIFAGVGLLVVLSHGYMGHAEHSNHYTFFVFLMLGSMLGLASASIQLLPVLGTDDLEFLPAGHP